MPDASFAPILLELDEATWDKEIGRAATWIGNVVQAQERFRKLAADTAAQIKEPHIKKYLEDITKRAGDHEEQARALAKAIGRPEPSAARAVIGAVAAKGAEVLASAAGMMGSARGNWANIMMLVNTNQDAIGAFGIVEQLGYALGLPELADPAFRIVAEKTKDQLLLQEYLLEMGPMAILRHESA